MKEWNYGDFYKQYDMTGEIHIGTGIVKVHDIFNRLPEFMMDADVIFSDPPYNKSALSGYYTKAGIDEKPSSFEAFFFRFLECVDLISPKIVCLEVGLPQTDMYINGLTQIGYKNIIEKPSYYYGSKDRKCNILIATKSDEIPQCLQALPYCDEEQVIEYICKNVDYKCIADLCMGKGLVGYYSNKYGKRFVGTELNPKRLAVCCERVTKNERGKIN